MRWIDWKMFFATYRQRQPKNQWKRKKSTGIKNFFPVRTQYTHKGIYWTVFVGIRELCTYRNQYIHTYYNVTPLLYWNDLANFITSTYIHIYLYRNYFLMPLFLAQSMRYDFHVKRIGHVGQMLCCLSHANRGQYYILFSLCTTFVVFCFVINTLLKTKLS